MKQKLILALVATAIAFPAFASKDVNEAIQYRQSGYKFMEWNMLKLKAMLIDQPESFNKDKAVAAANAVQAIANSGMGALYVPGSDKGKGWHDTHVKPELFKDKEGVGKVAKTFVMESNELAKVAATGDAAALKAQFGKLGEACKACHDDYRKKDH